MANRKLLKLQSEADSAAKKADRLVAEIAALEAKAKAWPKVVKVSLSRGKRNPDVFEAFEDAGIDTGDVSVNHVCEQAYAYFRVTEDGTVTLTGFESLGDPKGILGEVPKD